MNAEQKITGIYFTSKTLSLIILAITAIICSRMLFLFFNDPEGPNLLIVTVFALAVFLVSAAAYIYVPSKLNGLKRLTMAVCMQVISVTVLCFLM